jgi:hypothetical protein
MQMPRIAGHIALAVLASVSTPSAHGAELPEPVSDVFICPSERLSSKDHLVAIDYPPANDEPGSPTAFLYRGEGPINTFIDDSSERRSACAVVTTARPVARDVTARLPRAACSPDDTIIASDMTVFETAMPIEDASGPLFAVSADGVTLGMIVAVAGPYIVVNNRDQSSARIARANLSRLDVEQIKLGAADGVGLDTALNRIVFLTTQSGVVREATATTSEYGSPNVVARREIVKLLPGPFRDLQSVACP